MIPAEVLRELPKLLEEIEVRLVEAACQKRFNVDGINCQRDMYLIVKRFLERRNYVVTTSPTKSDDFVELDISFAGRPTL